METTPAVRENKAVAPRTQSSENQALSSDLVIPYLLMCQAGSDAVKERKAQIGDFIRSTTKEKLGSVDEPVEVVFLHTPKTFWRIDRNVPGTDKWQFFKVVPRTTSNEVLDFKFYGDKDGNETTEQKADFIYRRFKQFRVFCLLPRDIAAAQIERDKAAAGELPDPSKALSPVLLSLQSSSGYPCGKDITTFCTKAATFGVPVWRYILKLTGHLETNDNNTFYCWDLGGNNPAKPVEASDLEEVSTWAKLITGQGESLKTDETAENSI